MKNNKSKKRITVIGVGYVGLPLACLAANKDYQVDGLDINKQLTAKINKARIPFQDSLVKKLLAKVVKNRKLRATTQEKVIQHAEIVIVCVPTPVDENYQPDFKPLIKATETIKKNLKDKQLIIIESTINPGVCEEVILPILEDKNNKVGKNFYLAHAPERINPGDLKWNVANLPRNIGAMSKEGLTLAVDFYSDIIEAKINPMKSIREAEATKTIENAFRDINIAFINEIAKSFDQLGIDVVDVIKGAASKFSFMPHWPSCGVGGHCIPVDPYYLIRKAEIAGFSHDFLKLARKINNEMPKYTVEMVQDELNKLGMAVKNAKIAVLGVAYKADIDDTRESPSFEIIKLLKDMGAKVSTYDPYVKELSSEKDLNSILEKAEILLIATDHKQFKNKLKPIVLKKYQIKAVIDGKNCLDKEEFAKQKIVYKGIGR
ncbi:MAG: nucleotide sugar dehydrogenase [Candidatus Moranbacteria bacterium]|nr:nucleotide sugar dehydrogenase [Candidatus Moranbacteria bacterium]